MEGQKPESEAAESNWLHFDLTVDSRIVCAANKNAVKLRPFESLFCILSHGVKIAQTTNATSTPDSK